VKSAPWLHNPEGLTTKKLHGQMFLKIILVANWFRGHAEADRQDKWLS
jgi:hypothetical protein